MTIEQNIQSAEAIIFASGDGISFENLKDVLEIDDKQMEYIISTLEEKYNTEKSGVLLSRNEDVISFVTHQDAADIVYKALNEKKNSPLSNAAMETLAIIAYNQPVSKAFIEQVRGVDSNSSVQNLLHKGLIEEAGRLEIPGRPISYRTTAVFLRSFSLESLADLPKIKSEKELEQISDDDISLEEENNGFDT